MESLYESSPEMCPAEPDGLANVGCSDGCELLTGEVCEASWWDGLLSGSCAEGSGGDLSEGQQVDTSMVSLWSEDSSLEDACGIPAFHADLGPIPCMADELEHFSEQLTHSLPCQPETPALGLQNCLSSSNMRALSGGHCSKKVPVRVPVSHPALHMPLPPTASKAAVAEKAAVPQSSLPPVSAPAPKAAEEEEEGTLSPSQRVLRLKLPNSLSNAVAVRDGSSSPFPGAWRGCVKSAWCNRERRHRGVCNTRAEVPGLAAYGAQQLEAHGVRGADFPPEWAPLCAKEGAACDDPDDSEQASATGVLLERVSDGDVQCLDSGVPRNCQVKLEDQNGPRLHLIVKLQQRPAAGPPTPQLQAPLFASQDSSNSADSNIHRETDASSQETGVTDDDSEVGCKKCDGCSPPPKPQPKIVSGSDRPRRSQPTTPNNVASRTATKASPESLNQSLAAVAVSSGKPVASPFAEACTINSQQSAPTAQTCGARPATPGGFVQTSSGRIARPTPKTAASRASSGDLSELFHTEGQRSVAKRKSGRPAKGCDKGKRRRMVGGVLKTVGHAAPGQQCTQCGTQVTPVWRAGPYGPKTLCNACGVRYMKQVKKK